MDTADTFMRALTDARVTQIYGGISEVMKEIIGRSLDGE
jgi:alkylation response protein AidB-like acyl-CoA dehydrogenase